MSSSAAPASSLRIKWTRIPLQGQSDLHRSSHSVSVVGSDAYIFGGELVPRTPLGEGEIYKVDLKSGETTKIITSPSPSPRVGLAATSIGSDIFLWGGRGGKEMTPLAGELWKFDTKTESWSTLDVQKNAQEGDEPVDRSFHVLTSFKDTLYLHAGCPVKGRISTLHTLSPTSSSGSASWSALPSAPEPGRGGANLTPLPTNPSLLVRFGGFAGHELDGLDLFSPADKAWSTPDVAGASPGKRSVAGFVGFQQPLQLEGEGSKHGLAVLFLGERDPTPADVGHDGAGLFHQDAFVLAGRADGSELEWVGPLQPEQEGEVPSARGWFGYDAYGKAGAVLFGGLEDDNSRAGDLWTLEVVKA